MPSAKARLRGTRVNALKADSIEGLCNLMGGARGRGGWLSTSLTGKRTPLGPYRRPMPRALWWSCGGVAPPCSQRPPGTPPPRPPAHARLYIGIKAWGTLLFKLLHGSSFEPGSSNYFLVCYCAWQWLQLPTRGLPGQESRKSHAENSNL